MIFLFPDFDTFRLALTSGVVPPAISLEPAIGGVDDTGRPWIEATVKPTRPMVNALAKLGVSGLKSYPTLGIDLVNWLQLLPVRKEAEPPVLGNQTNVLFELPDSAQLPIVVGEMMRLSNDRQSFRWLKEDAGAGTVLLRVAGPPYYTLLRALDREEAKKGGGIRAYLERAPRVWVEIGHTHDLVEKIQPQEGQSLLLRAPRDWVFLTDAPFRDIYEILDFRLPQARLDWMPAELKNRLKVPLRLIDGDRADPELWVLRINAADQLDALVRDARESTLQRLLFAVGQRDGETTIVLRARPSKQPPPQLVLEARAYAKFLKLDNLFVPVGSKVHPVLRRDAIRKLLAGDPAQINWLEPHPEKAGHFIPESLPEDAFRPLPDWVEYVLDHDRQQLENWAQEFRFDFDAFICPEEDTEPKAKPPGQGRRRRDNIIEVEQIDVEPPPKSPKKKDAPKPERDEFAEIEVLPPNQLQLELKALEDQFLALPGSLDDGERLKLWPKLALHNAALKHTADAALCWMNRIWEEPETNEAILRGLAWSWVRTEAVLPEAKLTMADLDRQMRNEAPSMPEMRAFAASVFWGALQKPPAEALVRRLPHVQQYLEKFERNLGVRAAWLAWYAVCKTAHGDALGLARIRDRLLDRLISEGLNPERDLPNFLRSAGHHDSERMRVVRAHALGLHDAALGWCDRCNVRDGTAQFVDLIFSFGLARLGEAATSRELLNKAEEQLNERNKKNIESDVYEVRAFLTRAFRFRIEQALQGRPHSGPLPEQLREELDLVMPRGLNTRRMSVDRLREKSRILEPQENFDPYRDYRSAVPNILPNRDIQIARELELAASQLESIRDPAELRRQILKLLKDGVTEKPNAVQTLSILKEGLTLAPRIGEAFASQLLLFLPSAVTATETNTDNLEIQSAVLERAIALAGLYDRAELVQRLLRDFLVIFRRAAQDRILNNALNRATGQCLRSLRKLRLNDEARSTIDEIGNIILAGKSVESLKLSLADPKRWPDVLQALLHLAGGWLSFGLIDRAEVVLREAQLALASPEPPFFSNQSFNAFTYTELARTYATCLGQAPVEEALSRIQAMFGKLWKLPRSRTSSRFYSELHLNIIEAVVLAVVHEDFAMGPGARRWMDDDEYLVRRRIHRDHAALLAKNG